MTKDWQRIEDLFHVALTVKAEERSAYLTGACAGDEELRCEVESLIAALEKEQSFMEQPALSLGLQMFSDSEAGAQVGQTIGPYKIISLLGRGGMGAVYLAEDSKLNRNVALKFFTSQFMDDEWMQRQLTREARAVAKLEHPNICGVYGIEQIDGHSFIVMQYVEGETLDALLARGPLELQRILDLSDQIFSALAAAHAHGIIHRDIKPQNIIVSADGQIKVLDFGLAKVVQQRQNRAGAEPDQSQFSQAGLIVGTVAYMSPEQLRAEELDFRSDIFSAGILLYELISGKNPYRQGSEAETISAILTSQPSPPMHRAVKIPTTLSGIVRKCLEKDKERRYQSASELLSALREVQQHSRRRIQVSLRAIATLALIILLTAGLLFAYVRVTRVHTLAILPVVNESADAAADDMGKGLTQSLINQLSRLYKLRVKAPSVVPVGAGGAMDLQQIGRDLKVDSVLVEKIIRRGESLFLQATLVNIADGATLWGEEFDLKISELQTLYKEISDQIIRTLQPWVSSDEKKYLAKSQTDSPEAYRLYLLGRSYWDKRDKENIEKAINYFTQATEIDPLYALAWTGLADAYASLSTVAYGSMPTGEAMPKARAAAKKALEIDDNLCEAHISLGVVKLKYEWNWPEAEREFKRAIDINPDNASAHYWYTNLLLVLGRSTEAIAESERARELDPFSPLNIMNLGRTFYRVRDYDRAVQYLKKALAENPNNSGAFYVLGYVYLQKAMYTEAIEIFEKIGTKNKWLAAAPLGYAYAKAGRRADALQILAEMEQKTDLPVQERAIVYLGLDDKDQTFLWLGKAVEERFAPIIVLTSEPLFDSLRSDSRFADLARKINLTP